MTQRFAPILSGHFTELGFGWRQGKPWPQQTPKAYEEDLPPTMVKIKALLHPIY